jgi:hypothetical protein
VSEQQKLSSLANSIWITRKARIQAEKRLLANAVHSQAILFWYSFISVAISIYYLKFNPSSEYASISWVIFSVLVLCVSCFINGFKFESRAGLIKECYETLGELQQRAKVAEANAPESEIRIISQEYKKQKC